MVLFAGHPTLRCRILGGWCKLVSAFTCSFLTKLQESYVPSTHRRSASAIIEPCVLLSWCFRTHDSLVCFTICLFISPDLDGNRGTSTKNVPRETHKGSRNPIGAHFTVSSFKGKHLSPFNFRFQETQKSSKGNSPVRVASTLPTPSPSGFLEPATLFTPRISVRGGLRAGERALLEASRTAREE
jgi:hypothetical protein